jgi:hypothetical protein
MKHIKISHGMNLDDAMRAWNRLGGNVVHRRRTGELLFYHEAMGRRPICCDSRRKDATRAVTTMLKKLAALSKVGK